MDTFVSCIQRAWRQLEEIITEICQQLDPAGSKNGHEHQDLLKQLFSLEHSWLLKNPMKAEFPATIHWKIDKWTLPDDIESDKSRILSELRALEGIALERVDAMLADKVLATRQLLQCVLEALSSQSNGHPPAFIQKAIEKIEESDHQRLLEHTILRFQTEIIQLECRLHQQSYRMECLERSVDKIQASLDCEDHANLGETIVKNGVENHAPAEEEIAQIRSHVALEEESTAFERQTHDHSNRQGSDEDPERLKRIIDELREAYRVNMQSMVEEVLIVACILQLTFADPAVADPISPAAHRRSGNGSSPGGGVESGAGR